MNAPTARPPNPVVQAGWKMSLAILLVIGGLLLAGVLMNGTWEGEASRVIDAPPDSVFALLDSPRRWDEWTPFPQIAFTYEGPERGPGARRSWDAPEVGSGSFTILDAQPSTRVSYEVVLDGQGAPTQGSFALEPADGGTQVTWREAGDFGSNPIMAWAALGMRRRHGRELEERLEGLAAAARRAP